MLTQTYLKELFNYREDGNLIWRSSNRPGKSAGKQAGTPHSQGYMLVGIDYKTYLLHRLIFLWHHGYIPARIDHKDKNPSNNRIENLRPITQSQNIYNSKPRDKKTSIYRGVSRTAKGKWLSQIRVSGQVRYLGIYHTQEAAAVAYNMAVIDNNLLPFIPLNEIT